jgi:hypothetical protein
MLLPAVHAKADAFMVMLTEELTEIKTSPPLGHVFFVSSTKSPSTRSLLVLAFERDEKILMRTKVCDLNSKELPPKSTKDTVTKNVMQQFGLKDWEINLLYYTLFIDTHIKSIDPLTISLGGLVFRNNGGYSERTKAKLLEAQRLENIQSAFRKDSLGLMIFTAIVAFGTMISAFYFALEVYRYFTGK